MRPKMFDDRYRRSIRFRLRVRRCMRNNPTQDEIENRWQMSKSRLRRFVELDAPANIILNEAELLCVREEAARRIDMNN